MKTSSGHAPGYTTQFLELRTHIHGCCKAGERYPDSEQGEQPSQPLVEEAGQPVCLGPRLGAKDELRNDAESKLQQAENASVSKSVKARHVGCSALVERKRHQALESKHPRS